jgi:uncharacterized protein YmfQ (DUF2313 family)
MGDHYVKRNQDDYAEALSELRPRGPAWPRDPQSDQMLVIHGMGGVWGIDVSGAADKLLVTESFPPSSIDMLPDWEASFGLPDKCVAEPLTIDDRHRALVQRMTTEGGASRAFFINLAAQIGYTISIVEYSPFQCGISMVGDTRGIFNPDTPDEYRWQLGPPELRYYWTVHVDQLRISYFYCASGQCGIDPLSSVAIATDLECILRRYAPGHTVIVFNYTNKYQLDFSEPFNSGYLLLFTGSP